MRADTSHLVRELFGLESSCCLQAQNFAGLAFGDDLERAATDFAIDVQTL